MLTVGLPWRGLSGYLKYRRGAATVGDVESFLAHAFLHRRFLDRHEGRPVVVSIVDLVSLAQDIDTQGELNQVAPIGIE